ncbi:MAG: DUF2807 domain-containing protein, partial [Bacteroidetes bacterium]|nr:DUF2807 domain-containing protein [Bacteroidota bacterium]
MKITTLLPAMMFISCVTVLTSCDDMTVKTGDGSEKVEADVNVTSETREVSTFNKISMEGVFNIILIQGNRESIKVEAGKNIIPLVETTVENNKLTVKIKDNTSISKMKKINVYITFVDVAEVSSEGVGTLTCNKKLRFNDLKLDLKGIG